MEIKKSTIIRAILFAIVLIRQIASKMGYTIPMIDESVVASSVDAIIEIAIVVLAWWKNNSFTQDAIRADLYLEKLKKLGDN